MEILKGLSLKRGNVGTKGRERMEIGPLLWKKR
jgi:hypothetical protein